VRGDRRHGRRGRPNRCVFVWRQAAAQDDGPGQSQARARCPLERGAELEQSVPSVTVR
jgi:hypothetical protein